MRLNLRVPVKCAADYAPKEPVSLIGAKTYEALATTSLLATGPGSPFSRIVPYSSCPIHGSNTGEEPGRGNAQRLCTGLHHFVPINVLGAGLALPAAARRGILGLNTATPSGCMAATSLLYIASSL
jgi:hypothetical protein